MKKYFLCSHGFHTQERLKRTTVGNCPREDSVFHYQIPGMSAEVRHGELKIWWKGGGGGAGEACHKVKVAGCDKKGAKQYLSFGAGQGPQVNSLLKQKQYNHQGVQYLILPSRTKKTYPERHPPPLLKTTAIWLCGLLRAHLSPASAEDWIDPCPVQTCP